MTTTAIDMLKEYASGDVLAAADVNALIAVARRQNNMLGGVSDYDASSAIFGAGTKGKHNTGWSFKNESGSSVPAGGVMRPTTSFAASKGPGHNVSKPDWRGHEMKLVNDLGCDRADGSHGPCAWAHCGAWCRIASGTPAFGERWGTTIDSFALSKPGDGTFLALGSNFTASGATYGLFVQLPEPKAFAVLNGSLSHGSSTTAERIRRNSGGTAWERSGTTYAVHDLFQNTDDVTEADTIITHVPYCGLQVVDAIWCAANDWGL